jgi:DNA-binding NtrC family response regulator
MTDVVLPGMNGFDLAQRMKALRPEVKVLFMSGYADDILAQQGTIDSSSFVQKPFTLQILTRKIREVLGRRSGAAIV